MDNLKDKISIILVYLCLVSLILLCVSIFPYKEILECYDDNCTIERSYVLFKNRDDAYYYFKKTDDIQVVSHHSSGQRGLYYYEIENASDYNFSIFNNTFAGKKTPEMLLSKIKSNNRHIKIIKYWIGHKIEKEKE